MRRVPLLAYGWTVLVAGGVLLGLLTSSPYVLQQGVVLCCYAMAVLGLWFAVQVAGQPLMGAGAIFALGGYASAVASATYHMSFLASVGVGIGFGIAVGLVISIAALRTSGWYFAMATFFLAAVVPNILQLFPGITGAATGLFPISPPSFGTHTLSPRGVFFLALIVLVVVIASVLLLRQSTGGRMMAVMRERSAAASAAGRSTVRLRIIAYIACSAPAAVGGVLYSHLYGFVQTTLFPIDQTILFFSAVVLGGTEAFGALIAIAILFIVPLELLSSGDYNDIFYAAVIILLTIFVARSQSARTQAVSTLRRFLPAASRLGAAHPTRPMQTVLSNGGPDQIQQRDTRVTDVVPVLREAWPHDTDQGDLVARNVEVKFGNVRAVDFAADQALVVKSGTVHALLGANGSGKTTFLNAICGFVRADGQFALGGDSIGHVRPVQRARMGIGRTWQSPALPGELTPLDLLAAYMSGAARSGLLARRRERRVRAERTLTAFGLAPDMRRPCRLLSSGNRRILDVLCAVSGPIRFLLLDEPGAGLTRGQRTVLGDLTRALADAGLGVILVEHDLELAMRVADTVTIMDLGRPIYQGPPQGVRESSEVRRAFLGWQDDAAANEAARGEPQDA